MFNGTAAVGTGSELPALLTVAKDMDFTTAIPAPTATFKIYGGPQPVALMRTSFTDPDATFVGMKGGTPSYNHAHMDVGSFVLDANGERWVSDLNSENYAVAEANILGSFFSTQQESNRWKVYRENNASHNVLKVFDDKQLVTGNAQVSFSVWDNEKKAVGFNTSSIYSGLVGAGRYCYLYSNKVALQQDNIITGAVGKTVNWQFITSATVSISNNVVTLTQHGKTMVVKVVKNYGDMNDLHPVASPASPTTNWENPNVGYTRVS